MIEKLGRRALDEIRKLVRLPNEGTIAGGCISNLIWEFVSGNKAVINDVDIFVYKGPSKEDDEKKAYYKKKSHKYQETYSGLSFNIETDEYYHIDSVEYNGLLNFINYRGSNESSQVIINSFDINCTKVAYSIHEDKFYWDVEFEEFLQTHQLKFSNLMSPAHSAIRIAKKSVEMNVPVSDIEYRMCQYVLYRNYYDVNRRYFTTKNMELFEKYSNILSKYFTIERDENIEDYMRIDHNLEMDIYKLCPVNETSEEEFTPAPTFGFENIENVYSASDFIFYVRNIMDTEYNKMIWDNLYPVFTISDYIDIKVDNDKVDFLSRLIHNSDIIGNISGMKLSQQVKIVDKVFESFDRETAVKILSKVKIPPDRELDEDDMFLMEMSVRKQIHTDISYRIKKIFPSDVAKNNTLSFNI